MLWSNQQIDELRRRVVEGGSASTIAAAMHITRNAAMGKIHRLGLELKIPGHGGWHNKKAEGIVKKPFRRVRPKLIFDDEKREVVDVVRKDPVMPVVAVDEPTSAAITILFLTRNTCHWPLWDGTQTGGFYCGAPSKGHAYCLKHQVRALRA